MIFIFVMSAQQASKSSQLSGGIVDEIITTFIKKFDSLPLEKQEKSIYTITFLVRKTAHFLEYFILGLLSILIAITYNLKGKFKVLLSIAFCLIYAASDELHQYFVPGRACRLTDICIDVVGSTCAITIIFLIARKINKRKVGKLSA